MSLVVSGFALSRGKTKLFQRNRSALFAETSEVDVFFSATDPIAVAARAAAPVKLTSDGCLTVNHKTIQEHAAATAIVEAIREAVTGLSSEQLVDRAYSLLNPEVLQKEMNGVDEIAVKGEARKRSLILRECFQTLTASPMAELGLSAESAVLDFVLDFLLSDLRLVNQLQALVYLIVVVRPSLPPDVKATILGPDPQVSQALNLVQENLQAIVSAPVPRRRLGTLLHAAAAEGADRIVKAVVYSRVMMTVATPLDEEGQNSDEVSPGQSLAQF